LHAFYISNQTWTLLHFRLSWNECLAKNMSKILTKGFWWNNQCEQKNKFPIMKKAFLSSGFLQTWNPDIWLENINQCKSKYFISFLLIKYRSGKPPGSPSEGKRTPLLQLKRKRESIVWWFAISKPQGIAFNPRNVIGRLSQSKHLLYPIFVVCNLKFNLKY